ncbi:MULTISPECIES: TetR/AcrR family transcriptional regulator [unclassified Streptomyces]|uniref:TetR/AcrR family transcriptional regulator n=1 Tax=unclassified Streptomyces TaxID=2593676 RepID=UPI00225B1FA1|nr:MULTISPECIES: TetR/AcrR family transcriptional regulator [unclassified Streptomyces]MCX4829516.1 TetR/AcrR family transcriptional regulator [Streptomyces sp. NBC_01016]
MGHREDLLEGAKRCLLEKGFARTTARDIVKESGANLASIGYHYGSKDALLAQAYLALVEESSDVFDQGGFKAPAGSLERFQEVWGNVIESLGKPDSMWYLGMELVVLGDKLPAVREIVGKAQSEGGRGTIPMFMGGEEPPADHPAVDTLGKLYMTLMTGLIAEYMLDPESAPSAEELTEGMRRLITAAQATESSQS